MTFDDFLASPMTNAWLKEPGMSVYVRKSLAYPGLIDLANINAKKPGKGAYKAFLAQYEATVPFRVENVLTARFADYHRRIGWTEIPNEFSPSFLSPMAFSLGLFSARALSAARMLGTGLHMVVS
jgi:hypothetical protein